MYVPALGIVLMSVKFLCKDAKKFVYSTMPSYLVSISAENGAIAM